ncbi:hypothetical protein AWB75_04136 [Caballeronia catudaia]|uniref:Uncharacterized protein n=1 Tax=Caballeronia catudaia TaxID=1777136 RepID=A0A158BW86_9BURK|nr:hypothetical protein AWB75_04136 [Caballeronia catudaia]
MTTALSTPYHDEHLYSTIARYMKDVGVSEQGNATRALFGDAQPGRGEILCGLDHIARETHAVWNMSAIEIAERFTLLPYFTRFVAPQVKESAYASTIRGGLPRPYAILGLLRTTVKCADKLRFCAQCVEEDVSAGREPYWRRVHQLPGVFICTRHRTLLRISDVPFRSWRNNSACWHTLQAEIPSGATPAKRRSDLWLGNPHVVDVMVNSAALLYDAPRVQGPPTYEYYFSRARENGFECRAGCIDSKALCASFSRMFGEEFLEACGLSVAGSGCADPWPLKLMVSRWRKHTYQPLQHVVLEHFFDALTDERPSLLNSTATPEAQLTCPNRFARHGVGHVLDRVALHEGPNGNPVGRASCACGFWFSFRLCDKRTSEPVVDRVLGYGDDMRDYARRLRLEGMSRSEIAETMGLPFGVVRRFGVRGKHLRVSSRSVTRSLILRYRKEWSKILTEMPVVSHTRAMKEHPHIAAVLSIHDHEWYMSSYKKCFKERSVQGWRERDRCWCIRLREALKRIKAKAEPVRTTRKSLAREAGLWINSTVTLANAPRCRAFLAQNVQTVSEFQIQRLEWAARRIIATGATLSRASLLARAHLRRHDLTPNLDAVVTRLTGTN